MSIVKKILFQFCNVTAVVLLLQQAQAQTGPAYPEYEEYSTGSTPVLGYPTSVATSPTEDEGTKPPEKVPDYGGSSTPSVPHVFEGPESDESGNQSCGIPGSGGDESQPDGANGSFDKSAKLADTPAPGGGKGPRGCGATLPWNLSPTLKTNARTGNILVDSGETDAGNNWFLDRPRLWHSSTTPRVIDVRWNAFVFRTYTNNTPDPPDYTQGWIGSGLSSDQRIYRTGPEGASGDYNLHDPTGRVYVFEGVQTTQTTTLGTLKEIRASGGASLAIQTNAARKIALVQQKDHLGAVQLEWHYTYEPDNANVVQSIAIKYPTAAQPFRVITYKHKTPSTSEPDANDWDLIGLEDRWIAQEASEGGESGSGTVRKLNWAFRYYTNIPYDAANHPGYQYQLRAVIGPFSFKRYTTGDIYAATLSQVDGYIDEKYEYYFNDPSVEEDDRRRIKSIRFQNGCGCGGGTDGTFTYDWEVNPSGLPSDFSTYQYMVIITEPSLGTTNSERRIWYNRSGQKLAERYQESNAAPISSGRVWNYVWEYDALGRVSKEYSPEAIGEIETPPPPQPPEEWDPQPIITKIQGLSKRYEYVESVGAYTLRTKSVKRANGDADPSPVLIYREKYREFVDAATKREAFLIVEQTTFPSAATADTITYDYPAFYGQDTPPEPLAVKVRTVTRPAINYTNPSGTRGPVEEREFFGRDCKRTWFKDGAGYVHHTKYDYDATLKRLKAIRDWQDINTTSPPAGSDPFPTGLGFERSPAGSPQAINQLVETEFDSLGRIVARTTKSSNLSDPGRREQWVYETLPGGKVLTIYHGDKPVASAPVGPVSLAVRDPALGDGVLEEGIADLQPRDADVTDDWERDPGLQNLAEAAETTTWTFYARSATLYTSTGKKQYVRAYTTPDSALLVYDQTEYRYDALGRNTEVVNAAGTRTVSKYDDFDRVYETHVGKASESNLYLVEKRVYDETGSGAHGIGNGFLSRVEHETGVSGDGTRKVLYFYDWRNRLTTEFVLTSTSPTGYRVMKYTYDDLNRMTASEAYAATTSVNPPSDIDPLPAERRERTEYTYDSWGNVYETRVYEVDQTNGTYGADKYIATRTWRDKRNLLIKTRTNHSVLSKTEFDGLGRAIVSVVGYDVSGEENWDLDYADDTIMAEVVTAYDRVRPGNILRVTEFLRQPGASGLGRLSALPASVWRRATTDYWYDTLDRQTHRAYYGNGTVAPLPVEPEDPLRGPPPAFSDPVAIVSESTYDPAGRVEKFINPEQQVTKTEYDGRGRAVRITENLVSGTPAPDQNRIRDRSYDGLSHLLTETASTAAGGAQITEYVYGVQAGVDGSMVSSFDLLYMIKHPDPTNGSPGTSSQDQEKFGYNRQGELIWRRDQNGSEHVYKRNILGSVKEDALSAYGAGVDIYVRSIRSAYDLLGRVLSIESHDNPDYGYPTTGRNVVAYEYGSYGEVRKITQNPTGITTSGQPYVLYTYQYPNHSTANERFRLLSTQYPYSTVYSELYTDDAADQLSRSKGRSTGYPHGTLYTERFEGLGRIVERSLGSTAATYRRAVDAYGRVGQIDLYGGSFGTTASNTVDLFYCYNKNSEVVFKKNLAGYAAEYFSERFEYDGLMRLTRFDRGLAIGTECSEYGVSPIVETQTWANLDHSNNWGSGAPWYQSVNRANEITSLGYGYDHNGNTTAIDPAPNNQTLIYDGWNRLVSITRSGYNYGAFRYNGLGQLVTQQTSFPYYNHSNDKYYYDVNGRLIEEWRFSTYAYVINRQFVWSSGALDDIACVWQASTNTIEHYLQDANWNVIAITNGTSSIKERYRYSPYGGPVKLSANWTGSDPIYDDIPLFTGQRYNWINGMYNYKARYYRGGRFLQGDPPGTWYTPMNYGNKYAYVGSDPPNRTDPRGRFVCIAFDSGEAYAASTTLPAAMKNCGLNVELVDDNKCECCKGEGTRKRLKLTPGQTIPRSMSRVAHFINNEDKGFCLDIELGLPDVDAQSNSRRRDSKLDPDKLVAQRNVPIAKGTYNRSACSLLAHVFGENWWDTGTGGQQNKRDHIHGFAEENWVRLHEGELSISLSGSTDPQHQALLDRATVDVIKHNVSIAPEIYEPEYVNQVNARK